jgi:PAS domain S-box-containing protein
MPQLLSRWLSHPGVLAGLILLGGATLGWLAATLPMVAAGFAGAVLLAGGAFMLGRLPHKQVWVALSMPAAPGVAPPPATRAPAIGAPATAAPATGTSATSASATGAIADNHEQLRILVDGVVDYSLFMISPEGQINSWNPGAERIKGYAASEIIGRHFSVFYTEADRAAGEPARALANATRDGRFEQEGFRVRKDGSRFWASVVIDRIQTQDGKLAGFAKITRDITERRELERRLAQAQKMEAVGQLTGGIAHDFNNLLQAVGGNLDIARKAIDDGDAGRADRLIGNATRAIERGARLTTQLLAFSRRQILRAEQVHLGRLIGDTRDLIVQAAGDIVHPEVEVAENLWPCVVDAGQFEASLLNLIINARDAMPEGGRLRIRLSNVRLDSAAASAIDAEMPEGDYVRIDVEDEGTGMTAEVRARAFEPFFTTKDIGRGSGLGLPQVHGFTRQSGGGVALRTAPGQGTVVSLFFQRAEKPSGGRDSKPARSAAGPRTDILLVEDDPAVLEVMQLMLVDAGHRVVAARNGVDAMALLAGGVAVDVLVSDVVMPGGMSGVELAREARRMQPDLGILLVSGYAADVLVRHGAAEEFDILHKPYAHAELLSRVTRMRAQRGQGAVACDIIQTPRASPP